MASSIRDLWNYIFEIITCDTRDHWEQNIAFIEKVAPYASGGYFQVSNASNRIKLTFIVSEKTWRKFCNFSQKTSKNETEIIGVKV